MLESILKRPDTYVGSLTAETESMFVYDEVRERMVQRKLSFVPGLFKIFDEILVNAADHRQREPSMNSNAHLLHAVSFLLVPPSPLLLLLFLLRLSSSAFHSARDATHDGGDGMAMVMMQR